MLNEKFAKLLVRKLSGEATATELQELEEWLRNNPGDQYFLDIYLSYWNSYPDITSPVNANSDQHFAHILEMAGEKEDAGDTTPVAIPAVIHRKNLFSRFKKIAIAASLVGIIIISIRIINNNNNKRTATYAENAQKQNEVVAKKGARSKIVLPDGTQVWLNSDSKLQYEESFNDSIRNVVLEGEAYFDVIKNSKRPFVVHTSGIDIRVLGTAFNVKSYPRESTIETTLIHGLIEVVNKKKIKSPRIILRPHEKLVFNKEEDVFERTENAIPEAQPGTTGAKDIAITALPKNIPDTSLAETSWVYNKLIFDGDTFRELAVKMERWFNVKISFKSERVANYRLRGVFENESIEEAMEALQVIASFNYKIKDNEIVINKK